MKIAPEGFWEWWKEKGKEKVQQELSFCMLIAMVIILVIIGGYFILN